MWKRLVQHRALAAGSAGLSSSRITNLILELGQATCSFWASFSPTLKLGAELGYLLASFHTVCFIF